jgi:histidyl-tRNA synthetase
VAKAVTALRDAGLKVEMALAGGKLGKQFQQAVKRGYRFAAIPNPEELAAGIVQLKDLVSGEQRPMMLADAARWSQDLDFHGAREQSGETGVSKP